MATVAEVTEVPVADFSLAIIVSKGSQVAALFRVRHEERAAPSNEAP